MCYMSSRGAIDSALTLQFRPKSNLEGFVWSHQSINGLISERQFAPKC